jgi:hypothetical protein
MKNTYLLIALLVIAGSLSCKKSNSGSNNPPQKTCRIHTIKTKTGTLTQTINFTYDEDKRITQIDNSDGFGFGKAVITYPTPGPYRLETFGNNSTLWFSRYDCSQYADGTLRHVVRLFNQPNDFPVTMDYAHDAYGNTVSRTGISAPPPTTQTVIYKWDNFDNLIYMYEIHTISLQPIGDSVKYTYYLDKIYDPPNVDLFSKYMINSDGQGEITMFGAPSYTSRNMLKSKQSGNGSKWTFTYEFDADGKVIKTKAVSDLGATSVVTYEYTCD